MERPLLYRLKPKSKTSLKKGDKVTIPAGSTQASAIIITVVDDTVYEKSEDMVLEISRPVNAVLVKLLIKRQS
ncbi:hypothetical protein [Psychrobacter sanguinis]|uniref:hypothetical protein n=1 Tax=Psychrobacter sanguinis TaxID=861445 RepID=UPI001D1534A1|nr:hypothetical protein [Psychrobacter sanguinis]UEC25574.1 hypothetical protein LK453_00015 [Psychrobacter sanguinis]